MSCPVLKLHCHCNLINTVCWNEFCVLNNFYRIILWWMNESCVWSVNNPALDSQCLSKGLGYFCWYNVPSLVWIYFKYSSLVDLNCEPRLKSIMIRSEAALQLQFPLMLSFISPPHPPASPLFIPHHKTRDPHSLLELRERATHRAHTQTDQRAERGSDARAGRTEDSAASLRNVSAPHALDFTLTQRNTTDSRFSLEPTSILLLPSRVDNASG